MMGGRSNRIATITAGWETTISWLLKACSTRRRSWTVDHDLLRSSATCGISTLQETRSLLPGPLGLQVSTLASVKISYLNQAACSVRRMDRLRGSMKPSNTQWILTCFFACVWKDTCATLIG